MSKEAMKLAIEALQYPLNTSHEGFNVDMAELLAHRAIKALEAALANQEHGEPAPVAKNENGSIKWLIDDWPQNCLLYTHPPESFTYEQVKAHIRAASMSANDIVVGSDVTNDGVSVVIRRRDEVLYAEFFATPQKRKPLTDEQIEIVHRSTWMQSTATLKDFARAIEAAHGIKE